MKHLATLVTIAFAHQMAHAAYWVDIATSPEGDVAYVDTQSIKRSGNKRIAWVRVDKSVAEPYQGGLLKSHSAQIEVNCKERTERVIFEVGYQPNGSPLYQFEKTNSAKPVVPDSLGEIRLEVLCKNGTKRQ